MFITRIHNDLHFTNAHCKFVRSSDFKKLCHLLNVSLFLKKILNKP